MSNTSSPSSSTQGSTSVLNPLCVILVKNGSKGDRLLFRYPYKNNVPRTAGETRESTPHQHSSQFGHGGSLLPNSTEQPRRRKLSDVLTRPVTMDNMLVLPASTTTPFSHSMMETGQTSLASLREGRSGSLSSRPIRKTSRSSPQGILYSNLESRRSPGVLDMSAASSDVFIDDNAQRDDLAHLSPADGAKMLRELSDRDLSNLLAVGSDLSERKFELKLNYVRFVGHPTLMQQPKSYRTLNKGFQTSVKLFNIVFCLNAVASHSIVKCFYDLSKRLGIALRHEEYRCGFLTEEFKSLVALHDEFCTEPAEDKEQEERIQEKIFSKSLKKSYLAQLLAQIYDDVVKTGCTFVPVNDWIQISFCLPQKIHTLKFRDESPLVELEAIHKCLEAIRPYHAILLLVEADELNASLWFDASSTISRLLQVYSPLKSLQTLAADADLTLSHVVEIASHLVYWAQATVIYPLCESNIYVVSPDIPITSSKLKEEFVEQFPGLSWTQVMADFSLPMPLGERINPVLGGNYEQTQQVQVVTWMLKYHLLVHLHTYVYLTTYFDGSFMDNGVDYLTAFTGNIDGSSLNIRPFEEDEATGSDSFSENLEDVNVNIINIGSASDKEGNSKNSLPTTPTVSENAVNINPDVNAFSEFNEAIKRALRIVKSPLSMQDARMFSRLSKYFTGDFHIEEIMYLSNVRRSQLLLILDKFRDCVVIFEKEDADINFFKLA